MGDHHHANLWLQQALKKAEEEGEATVKKADILEYMAFSAYIQVGHIGNPTYITNKVALCCDLKTTRVFK